MNEKEIIENLKELISWRGKHVEVRDYEIEAIEGLLDLYNKEKEKNKELNLENIELKQSKIADKNSIPNQDNFYDCYNYIHKDKIKTKIEEVQKRLKEETRTDFLIILKILENELQSLLEKEDNND